MYLRSTVSKCFCWNRPLTIRHWFPSMEPLNVKYFFQFSPLNIPNITSKYEYAFSKINCILYNGCKLLSHHVTKHISFTKWTLLNYSLKNDRCWINKLANVLSGNRNKFSHKHKSILNPLANFCIRKVNTIRNYYTL